MFCAKCGAKMYNDNAEFCSVCGAPLKQKNNSMSYQPNTYKSYNFKNDVEQKEDDDEWLNPEAIKEIWNVPQGNNQPPKEDLLPDGTPEWFDEIRQEEEYEEYKSKFHITEHPLIVTSLVAFLMVIISIISIVTILNV